MYALQETLKSESKIFLACGSLLIALLLPAPWALAHGGKIEIASGARGPVPLSDVQQKAIALKLTPADFRPIETVLNLNGKVQLLPDSQTDVTLRISGQVKALFANLGETVRSGQALVRVQSRLVGNPPPSVTVTAPMSGTIDARNIILGQAVKPDTVLFHISDRSQMMIVARVYEEDLGKIKLGQKSRIHLLSYPRQVLTGKITFISPQLNPLNRTVDVWIRLSNPQRIMKPNMFARASVILHRNNVALTVVNAAIIEANGEKFVFVREGNKYHRVEVTTGASDDQYTEITAGLVPGDEVATQGNRQIYTMWLTGGQMKAEE